MKTNSNSTPRAALWTGWVFSGLTILFMLFDAAGKLARESHVLKAQVQIGWPDELTQVLGGILLACTILYAIPRTAFYGAILLTAWLGGATAAKVRLEDPTLWFSVGFGFLLWVGLFFRDSRIRSLAALRSGTAQSV